jgi:type II secretory pathway predicted ATPase ExeA
VGHLLSELDADKYIAANMVTTHLEADDTLRTVAAAFGLSQEGVDKATLLKRIENFLVDCHKSGKRALLLVDEVQNMPVRALEELRMLSNFQLGEKPLLQSFLIGQPQFKQIIADPSLEQLRQRVIATYHLEPLDAAETRAYVEHRLKLVGWNNDPRFSDDAFDLIYEHTGGVPRRINTLCSRILLFGFLEERHDIDRGVVEEVINDLLKEGAHHGPQAKRDVPAEPAAAEHKGEAPKNGSGAVANDDLAERVALLEEYVRAHDRTINRALEIAASWLDGDDAEAGQ